MDSNDGTGMTVGNHPPGGGAPQGWPSAPAAGPASAPHAPAGGGGAGFAAPASPGGSGDFLWSPQPPRRRVMGRVLLSVAAVCALVGGGVILGRVFAPGVQPATSSPEAEAISEPASSAGLRSGDGSYVCSSPGVGVTCWGADLEGKTVAPAAVAGLETVKVSALSVGRGFAVAVDEGGVVYSWGANDLGQLGTTPGDAVTEATEVGRLPAAPDQVVSGNEHTCALVDSSVFCFGSNRYGQVTGSVAEEPSGLTQVSEVQGAIELGTSGYDTWALTAEGTWVWGNNSWGQADPAAQESVLGPVLITEK
ncbi:MULTISPECIES: hypothetical protein [Actinomyces]|uniref:Chromosome condensation regulator RCC1 n=2 Tax=Actinomyces TaxID=1654 RepID=A0A853EHW8_9ACTO|nr:MULTISPECIES: hypothetical protein [Actinomyces]MBF0696735.1 hypothetical protein [Actinomyces bowdenii]MDO5064100.1 hypothetical protein [Actinomyces bowdenii]NYS68908.1 hypothetical protein [Actinomyces bowdenii]BDA63466.1 hypothetical protein MANAM107_03000 [Actinomyces capricornis]